MARRRVAVHIYAGDAVQAGVVATTAKERELYRATDTTIGSIPAILAPPGRTIERL